MGCVALRLRFGSAIPLGCALAMLWATPALADSDLKLFSADNFELTGDVRIVVADGEKSWVRGGFGKLRSSGDGNDVRLRPQLGNVNVIWQPQFTWSISATVVGSLQGGERTEAGLSQAFLTYRPMRGSKVAFSARAGLMFPPVSLEHEGADWHVRDSITPSAINSWIGEEVKPAAVEGTLSADLGEHKLRAAAALIAANDTSGTLLTLESYLTGYQAPYTHPLLDVHEGFAHRPGYYAKVAWQPPVPVRIELSRYDNRANPEDANADNEWGWRTKFNNLGIAGDLGDGTQLKAQALVGRTRMGFKMQGRPLVDNRFRSAFVMLVHAFGPFGLAARAEAFDTRNSGSLVDNEYDESGWSAMLAARRDWGAISGLVELLHVSSRREDWEEVGLEPRQRQTQLQASMRIHW